MVGVAIPLSVRLFADIKIPISPLAIIVAFGVSCAVGLIFGILPANRAAQLNPTDIRHASKVGIAARPVNDCDHWLSLNQGCEMPQVLRRELVRGRAVRITASDERFKDHRPHANSLGASRPPKSKVARSLAAT